MNIKKKTLVQALVLLTSLCTLEISMADPAGKNVTQSLKSELTNYRLRFSQLKTKLQEKHPRLSLEVGGFLAHEGTNQFINITGLIGDNFSVTNNNKGNFLIGLGYYIDGHDTKYAEIKYGINAFYLARTQVSGLVTQETLFTNLSYNYYITNWPIYFAAKAIVKNSRSDKYNFIVDAGIGPNITQTSKFNEAALPGSNSIPDSIFAGQTNTVFSAMAGLGLRWNNFFGKKPLTCGYRFLYLGESKLKTVNSQVLTSFKTGQNYANALLCGITF